LVLVDESDTIKNVTGIATLIDSSVGRTAATTLGITNSLFDGNLGTFSDYRIGSNNSGSGSYITFDFKAGNQATLTSVELAARQDQVARAKGTVIQGSNDNTNWTTLTAAAASTADWQTLPVAGGVPYRYIRVINGNAWYGNLAELRFHGTVQGADTSAPATTDNAPTTPVKQDVTVTLTAKDNSSGIATTNYKLDGGAQQTGNTVAVTGEGTHSLVYWSVDKAGNTEAPHTVTVKIDKTAPVTTAAASPAAPASGWYSSDVTFNFSASDAGGVANTYYTIDGGAQQTGATAVVSGKGTHSLQYWSVDQAGNTEAASPVAVNIGPIDLSSSVQFTQYGATLNRTTDKYVGSVSVTNVTGSTLTTPLQVLLGGLTSGVTLDNASGVNGAGAPYVTLGASLAPGASVSVPLTFTNPDRAVIGYTPALYKGNF
jgi:hypothetical protein